jgi:hypothetical protein
MDIIRSEETNRLNTLISILKTKNDILKTYFNRPFNLNEYVDNLIYNHNVDELLYSHNRNPYDENDIKKLIKKVDKAIKKLNRENRKIFGPIGNIGVEKEATPTQTEDEIRIKKLLDILRYKNDILKNYFNRPIDLNNTVERLLSDPNSHNYEEKDIRNLIKKVDGAIIRLNNENKEFFKPIDNITVLISMFNNMDSVKNPKYNKKEIAKIEKKKYIKERLMYLLDKLKAVNVNYRADFKPFRKGGAANKFSNVDDLIDFFKNSNDLTYMQKMRKEIEQYLDKEQSKISEVDKILNQELREKIKFYLSMAKNSAIDFVGSKAITQVINLLQSNHHINISLILSSLFYIDKNMKKFVKSRDVKTTKRLLTKNILLDISNFLDNIISDSVDSINDRNVLYIRRTLEGLEKLNMESLLEAYRAVKNKYGNIFSRTRQNILSNESNPQTAIQEMKKVLSEQQSIPEQENIKIDDIEALNQIEQMENRGYLLSNFIFPSIKADFPGITFNYLANMMRPKDNKPSDDKPSDDKPKGSIDELSAKYREDMKKMYGKDPYEKYNKPIEENTAESAEIQKQIAELTAKSKILREKVLGEGPSISSTSAAKPPPNIAVNNLMTYGTNTFRSSLPFIGGIAGGFGMSAVGYGLKELNDYMKKSNIMNDKNILAQGKQQAKQNTLQVNELIGTTAPQEGYIEGRRGEAVYLKPFVSKEEVMNKKRESLLRARDIRAKIKSKR